MDADRKRRPTIHCSPVRANTIDVLANLRLVNSYFPNTTPKPLRLCQQPKEYSPWKSFKRKATITALQTSDCSRIIRCLPQSCSSTRSGLQQLHDQVNP